VSMADDQYKAKKYDESRASYAKALAMKPAEAYPAQRVKTIENMMAAEQATMLKGKETEYTAAITAANKALANNQFPLAKESFQKALSIKPDDLVAKTGLYEVDRLAEAYAQRKALDEQYSKMIETADGYFAGKELVKARESYLRALALKPGDQYAQVKVTTIDNAFAAEQAAKLLATEEGYKAAIGAANTAIAQKSYSQAKEYLKKALAIKPADAYAIGKSAEVDRLIQEQQKRVEQDQLLAKQYGDFIASADKLFNDRDYSGARSSYSKALQIKPGDSYASQKILSIDNIVASDLANKQKQVDAAYKSAMDKGSNALLTKDYTAARDAFQQALAAKPADASALGKLSEAELLIRQEQNRIASLQTQKNNYDATIKAADQFFVQKNYPNAKTTYEKALVIMPGEAYPRQKLAETNNAIAEQERLQADKQAKESAYNLALVNADKYFRAKDLLQSRDEYGRALSIKPDAAFPKSKLVEIENLIRIRQKETDDAKAKADAYTAAINAGNAAYNSKDYPVARNSYAEALKSMPGDLLATDQIKKIDYLLAEAERLKKAETAKKAAYEALIASADKSYNAGNYSVAKDNYKQALAIEPSNAYPKERIAHIDEINRKLSQAPTKTNTPASATSHKVVAAIAMGGLNFKNESERQNYLDALKQKYPPGITLEKYKEQIKETYRYIIIRENQAQEFRYIKFTSFGGAEYSVNGKPITQQYFLSQVKTRPGESYQEIDMQ
jgi:hypothetical protein